MTFLPIGLNVTGKRILIIGGGKVGLHKATILHRFVSEAVVISPKFNEGFDELPFARIQKEYEPADLDGAFLVYICTENEALNRQIKHDAEARGILASVCDNPERESHRFGSEQCHRRKAEYCHQKQYPRQYRPLEKPKITNMSDMITN